MIREDPGHPKARGQTADVRVRTLPEPEGPRPPHRDDEEKRPDPAPRGPIRHVDSLHPPLRQRSLGDRREREELAELLADREDVVTPVRTAGAPPQTGDGVEVGDSLAAACGRGPLFGGLG